ncbi:13853_t:CDS:2 [Ambispora leptoticha]|uniref:13853_t:CDS:1 n=1 Tax=Ambispora leptoticha TaxID=144679 RepID=A0A9N8V944_9GLOM|nr:13853_t:CDS:2 [Ambispora leptoticha]
MALNKSLTCVNETNIHLTFGIYIDFPDVAINREIPFLYVDVEKNSMQSVTFSVERKFGSVVANGPIGHKVPIIDPETTKYLTLDNKIPDKLTITNEDTKPLSVGLELGDKIAATTQDDLKPKQSIVFHLPEKYYVGIFSEIEIDWPNWSAVINAKIPLNFEGSAATVTATLNDKDEIKLELQGIIYA